ncbi:MAG: aminoglycoside phosphotransferase family protein [Pyrinomonadaceae bacterium]
MNSTFIDSLPSELVTNVTAICGARGVQWFGDLEGIVAQLESIWSIETLRPFPAGGFNFVAPALRENGELAVLKISPPYEMGEIFAEAAFLRNLDGNGTIKLYNLDTERSALLLEHALPGKNLVEMFKGDEAAAVEPAIDVLRSMLSPVPEDSTGIATLDKWFDGMTRFVQTDFPAGYAAMALRIYGELSPVPDRTFYLHGDFHPGNVVNATRSPFLAIDPKGIVGHIGYDIAVFLNNFYWWQETRPDVRERLDRAVAQFADAFGLDEVELHRWAFAQTVLSAWWTFDESPETYSNEVAKADIWDV